MRARCSALARASWKPYSADAYAIWWPERRCTTQSDSSNEIHCISVSSRKSSCSSSSPSPAASRTTRRSSPPPAPGTGEAPPGGDGHARPKPPSVISEPPKSELCVPGRGPKLPRVPGRSTGLDGCDRGGEASPFSSDSRIRLWLSGGSGCGLAGGRPSPIVGVAGTSSTGVAGFLGSVGLGVAGLVGGTDASFESATGDHPGASW